MMNSVSNHPRAEEVCWTEKEGLWLNIVVKEEEQEADVTVNGDDELFIVNEEQNKVLGLEEGEAEIHATLNEEEEMSGVLNNIERPDSHSESRKSPSGEPDAETPKPARRHKWFSLQGFMFLEMGLVHDQC
ncbi:hypothetical protein UPYG_G00058680 [Umbra pygmaea]|uniref:Uncharacterized protein n=1 Tax=Umbra pygmaea TaxID=75934 RepID=A0ABD0XBX9_UMBPY